MVVGVTEGFKKDLEIQGVGYRAAKQGNKLVLTLASHPVEVERPTPSRSSSKTRCISASTVSTSRKSVSLRRSARQAPARAVQGKGIRYVGEYVIRKEGKAGKGK